MTILARYLNKALNENCFKILLLGLLLSIPVCAPAVTEAEMDQAKAIAAKFYIRYVNDGSGYLDGWTPSSMKDLENKLTNNKDKEILTQFKRVNTASDYKTWNKDMLVAYWSGTFFTNNASALNPKGASNGACKKQIKSALEKMSVTAQAPEAPQPEATHEEEQEPEALTTPEEAALQDSMANVANEIESAAILADQDQEEAPQEEKSQSSGTWVYVMVLAILVAIVIFLVVFASRTMKGQNKPDERSRKEEEPDDYTPYEQERPARLNHAEERMEDYEPRIADSLRPSQESLTSDTRMREKYARTLAAKAEEIRTLNRQIADLEAKAEDLSNENRALKKEVARLKNEHRAKASAETTSSASSHEADGIRQEVYLGRVNANGIFVRADRHAVDGQSIYKLITSSGTKGSFSLISNPIIEEQAMEDPGKWLSGGCYAVDIFDTDGRTGIETETPGTAVFRDGAWRVERKARIRYI